MVVAINPVDPVGLSGLLLFFTIHLNPMRGRKPYTRVWPASSLGEIKFANARMFFCCCFFSVGNNQRVYIPQFAATTKVLTGFESLGPSKANQFFVFVETIFIRSLRNHSRGLQVVLHQI